MEDRDLAKRALLTVAVVFFAILLGFYSTSEYVDARGLDYIENGIQLERHLDVLNGVAGNPWQYRVLAPFMIEPFIQLLDNFGVSHPVLAGFFLFRMLQDSLILIVSFLLYRKLHLSPSLALVGMAILAWGMAASHYDSDLQFSTFFDVLFYLLAGLCVLHRKFWLVVPLTALAALNRETSGLIPFLVLFAPLFATPRRSIRENLVPFLVSLSVFLLIFFGLRMSFPSQEIVIPYGHRIGFDLLAHNLFRLVTWRQLIATLSVVPFVALIGYRKWRPDVRLFFWVIVPIWFAVHAFSSVMAETRLFLVPQALVFVPGALCVLAGVVKDDGGAAADGEA